MMNHRSYLWITAVLFALVAVAHAVRVIEAWPLTIGEWPVPVAASCFAAAATATLSAWAAGLLRARR